jgi:hypothetical protein
MPKQRLALLFILLTSIASGQWLNYTTPGTPRLPNGKPNLAAPTPRGADGHPDLSGVWMHETTTVEEVRRIFGNRWDGEIKGSIIGMEVGTQHKYGLDILADFHPPESAMLPAAAERYRRHLAELDPSKVCGGGTLGFPLGDLLSEPIKISQAAKLTIILYESGNHYRQIYTDGRTLPKEFEFPSYYGYSVGRWEGDTLVVDTAGFNEKSPLDWSWHTHSDALHITERIRRSNFGNLEMALTIDDPKTFKQPFTVNIPHHLTPNADIFENFCENEKDAIHMKGQSSLQR